MERFDNWGTVWPYPFFAQEHLHRFWEGDDRCLGMRVDLKVSCSAEKQASENNCENELHLHLGFNICFPEFWITLLLEITSNSRVQCARPTWICPDVYQILNYDTNEVTRKVRTVYTWIKSAGWTCKHLKVLYDALASYSFRVSSWS